MNKEYMLDIFLIKFRVNNSYKIGDNTCVGESCWYDTVRLPRRSPRGRFHLEDRHPDTKGKPGLLRYSFGVGVVKDGDRYTELPPDVGD